MSAYQLLTPDQLKHVLSKTSPHSFAFNIKRMNSIYKLPINTEPTLDSLTKPNGQPETAIVRQVGFLKTLRDECAEGDEILLKLQLLHGSGADDTDKTMQRVLAQAGGADSAEGQKLIQKINKFSELCSVDIEEAKKDLLVDMADWLSDIMVYCRSEGMKYGLPIEEVLEAVMGSNFTKLPSNGIPLHDENGKFLKDMSNYVAPEGAIKTILFGMRAAPEYQGSTADFLQADADARLAAAQEVIGKTTSGVTLVNGVNGTSSEELGA